MFLQSTNAAAKIPSTRLFSTSSTQFFLGKLNKQIQATTPKKHVVEQLQKPLGVIEQPKDTDNPASDPRNLKQKYRDFMDPVKNQARQEELQKEMSRSGMYDVYTYRQTKGKMFLSPPSYWKAEKALYFPNFSGEGLSSSKIRGTTSTLKGKISVVRVFTSQVAEDSIKKYFELLDANYLTKPGYEQFLKDHPTSQFVDINVTENAFKAAFVQLSKSGIKKSLHEKRHDNYFIVPRKSLHIDLREQIQLLNPYTGYIYVVDHEGRIRWAACGQPGENDKNVLWRTVRGLEKEYKALHPTSS
ncbi:Mitochondrial ATPase complex subunit ATP10 [Wickerhamomyces ciferrii]|uniref:Mitochondrial ATPase complex subunit ATP10 n=1 Tax=Wickerhamomyces ciferrii (strain ATCC 14091 / BCRC 22168 / CBS 111 / JCM 3599 / NBRC 0793 / NRRL Y-1031 F-60-10) TaxID=1206466 RepID=K0KVY5_WICCF|nr:Mitochondrial ATPase complex subunit ATP10 [Wickerhamomyces ciferrii]CCH46142.1 Mitochondrial ATPase complex subunit ATP10 [Wickerhamomyces ciferrii]